MFVSHGVAVYRRTHAHTHPCSPHECLPACVCVGGGVCVSQFLEALEAATPVAADILILQTVMQQVYDHPVQKRWKKVRRFLQDADRRSVLFADRHHQATYTPRRHQDGVYETVADRDARAVATAVAWLSNHLEPCGIPVVFVSEDAAAAARIAAAGVSALSFREYVDTWVAPDPAGGATLHAQLVAMHESLHGVHQAKLAAHAEAVACAGGGAAEAASAETAFAPHPSVDVLADQWRRGSLLRGKLAVHKHVPTEATVRIATGMRSGGSSLSASSGALATLMDCGALQGGETTVLIVGSMHMNRAVHDDDVAVELLPRSLWRRPMSRKKLVSRVMRPEDDDDDDDEGNDDVAGAGAGADAGAGAGAGASAAADDGDPMPTGRVVGVFQRNWREYVATLPVSRHASAGDGSAGDGSAGAARTEEAVLVVPMDLRVPKIRIRTRQAAVLAGQRLVVAIDGWDATSKHPDGHYLRSLGPVLDMETEVQAVLVETCTHTHLRPFPAAALACLPTLPPGLPWSVDAAGGVGSRRDLRATHPVCSVDPPGCQDIDDALSVRRLPNGNLEVGVHIADVTHFVSHASALDLEARRRGTTVYLVDRRLDMLPSVLSENLCSLRARVDRFAMSVLWEFTPGLRLLPDRTWMGRTVIRSSHALTYYQAQRLIDGKHADLRPSNDAPVDSVEGGVCGAAVPLQDEAELRDRLRLLRDVARQVAARRTKDGALSLNSAELKFVLGDGKSPQAVKTKDDMEVHDTIAELMILANSSVAKFIYDAFPSQALLRRHVSPDLARFKGLVALAAARGIKLDASSNAALAKSMKALDRADVPVGARTLLRSMATRAMSEAQYMCTGDASEDAAAPFTHYGLALEFYTHFTSPIRRYADVVVHRLLAAALSHGDGADVAPKHARRAPRPLPESLVKSVLDRPVGGRPGASDAASVGASASAAGGGARRGGDAGTGWGNPTSSAAKASTAGWGAPTKRQPKKPAAGGWGVPAAKAASSSSTGKSGWGVPAAASAPAAPAAPAAPSAPSAPSAPAAIEKETVDGAAAAAASSASRAGWGSPTAGAKTTAGDGDAIATGSEQPPECVEPGRPPFEPRALAELCDHINDRNRSAKVAGWESTELFLALFLRDHPQVVKGVVVGTRSNGFLAFIPKFGVKLAVFLTTTANVTMAPPSLFGLPSTASAGHKDDGDAVEYPADDIRAALRAEGALPEPMYGASVVQEGHGDAARIAVRPPPSAGPHAKPVQFKALQRVSLLLYCDFTEANVRRPPARLELLGATPTVQAALESGASAPAPAAVDEAVPEEPPAAVLDDRMPTVPATDGSVPVMDVPGSALNLAATLAAFQGAAPTLTRTKGAVDSQAGHGLELMGEAPGVRTATSAPAKTRPAKVSEAVVLHKGRFRFGGFEPPAPDLATARRRAAAQGKPITSLMADAALLDTLAGVGDDHGAAAGQEPTPANYPLPQQNIKDYSGAVDDGPVARSVSRLASNKSKLKQAELDATRRMAKLQAERRHDRVNRNRRKK